MEKSALVSPVISELGEAQLRELHVAQEAQARYMSFLSHDLRGSLNGLVLMVEVLKREVEGKMGSKDQILADLAMMKRALVDTVGMMERHVLADRLRRGRVEPRSETVKLDELVEEAISKTWPPTRPRPNLQVQVPGDAMVKTDREMLRSSLVELLDNLARHCGPCNSRLSARRVDGDWAIEVADDGPGIAPDRLEQLLDGAKRQQMRDRGLGLILTQLIAEALGGRFAASSEMGKGSSFVLSVPMASGG